MHNDVHEFKRWLSMLLRDTEAAPVAGDLLTYQGNNQVQWWDGGDATGFVPRAEWLQNGFVDRAVSAITFNNGTLTFDISPTGASFVYYIDGVPVTTAGDDIIIANSDGQHWIYYNDQTGTLVEVVNPTHAQIEGLFGDECVVAMVYWNTNTAEGYLFDERHGYLMSPATHVYLHETIGTQWAEGIGLTNLLVDQTGANNTHAQFGNGAGEVYDEDVRHDISAVVSTTGYECWWWDGTRWQWDHGTGYPILVGGTPRMQYNNFGAGTLVEIGNNNFGLAHLFATGAEDGDPIVIVGQNEYGNVNAAREGAEVEISTLLLGNLPSPELKPIATVIFQTANAYGNAVQSRVRSTGTGDDYIDWRTSPISPGGGVVTDHGSLGGLGDNDHPQYALAGAAGGLARHFLLMGG